MTTLEIMTPSHPRWNEFVDQLSEDLWGDHTTANNPRCQHDHRHAEKVLTELGGIDIAGTLQWLCRQGGFCDCEILFNVDTKKGEYAHD
jgi:Protein of unknown function (DUF2695)